MSNQEQVIFVIYFLFNFYLYRVGWLSKYMLFYGKALSSVNRNIITKTDRVNKHTER